MMDWNVLENTCSDCTRCGLCETRNHVVFGVGNRQADIMFIGEGPGEQEDLQGIPFVGAAGQLLDDMLSIIDIDRTNCYIANIVSAAHLVIGIHWKRSRKPVLVICSGKLSLFSRRSSFALDELQPRH